MRGLFLTAAMAALFVTGCQRGTTEGDVQSQREDVLEQRQELAETRVEEQQRAQEEIQSEREDLFREEQELAETREEYHQEQAEQRAEQRAEPRDDDRAFGGAAEEGMHTLSGTIESKRADELTLKTEQGEQKLFVTPDTKFTWGGENVQITDIPEGSEVRASYEMKADRHVADEVEVLSQRPMHHQND
jgi:hypothetical protein